MYTPTLGGGPGRGTSQQQQQANAFDAAAQLFSAFAMPMDFAGGAVGAAGQQPLRASGGHDSTYGRSGGGGGGGGNYQPQQQYVAPSGGGGGGGYSYDSPQLGSKSLGGPPLPGSGGSMRPQSQSQSQYNGSMPMAPMMSGGGGGGGGMGSSSNLGGVAAHSLHRTSSMGSTGSIGSIGQRLAASGPPPSSNNGHYGPPSSSTQPAGAHQPVTPQGLAPLPNPTTPTASTKSSKKAAAASSAAALAAAAASTVPPVEADAEPKPPRVDLKVRKQSLDLLLGDTATQLAYWSLIERYLLVKLSKRELDDFVRAKLGPDNIHVHNDFVLAVLQNALSDELPPKPSKKRPIVAVPDPAAAAAAKAKDAAKATADSAKAKAKANEKVEKKEKKEKPATGTTTLSPESKEKKKAEARERKAAKKRAKEEAAAGGSAKKASSTKRKSKGGAKTTTEDEDVSSVSAWLSSPSWFKHTAHQPMAHVTKPSAYFHLLERQARDGPNGNVHAEYATGGGLDGQMPSWNVHPTLSPSPPPARLAPPHLPPTDGHHQAPKLPFSASATGTIQHTQQMLREWYQPHARAKSLSPRPNGATATSSAATSLPSSARASSALSTAASASASPALLTTILPSSYSSAFTDSCALSGFSRARGSSFSSVSSRSSSSRKRSTRAWDPQMESSADEDENMDDEELCDYAAAYSPRRRFQDEYEEESDGLDAYERLADPDTQSYLSSLQSQPLPDRELIRRRLYQSAVHSGVRHVSDQAVTLLQQATEHHLRGIISSILEYARPRIRGTMGRVAAIAIPTRADPPLPSASQPAASTTAKLAPPVIARLVSDSSVTPASTDVVLVPADGAAVAMDTSSSDGTTTSSVPPSHAHPPRALSVLIPSSPHHAAAAATPSQLQGSTVLATIVPASVLTPSATAAEPSPAASISTSAPAPSILSSLSRSDGLRHILATFPGREYTEWAHSAPPPPPPPPRAAEVYPLAALPSPTMRVPITTAELTQDMPAWLPRATNDEALHRFQEKITAHS